MTLVFDRRAHLGEAPGFHAFIVGVNSYPYLSGGTMEQQETYGLQQVTSPVPSALRVYEWLLAHQDTLRRPLATCRLLLSPPSLSETAIPLVERATLENFRKYLHDWRRDAAGHQDGGSFFYFAGHGIQRGAQDAVLLLEDFNEPDAGILLNAVSSDIVFQGMSPMQHATIARTQFYFVDACRIEPEEFQKISNLDPSPIWDVLLSSPDGADSDDRCAPFFYAALPGMAATAQPNTPTLFCRALLSSLDRATEGPELDANGVLKWPVRVYALDTMVVEEMDALLAEVGGAQQSSLSGRVHNNEIHFLDKAPEVPVKICVKPVDAAPSTNLTVLDLFQEVPVLQIPAPLDDYPIEISLPVGFYRVLSLYKDPTTSSITAKKHQQLLQALFRKPQVFMVK